MSHLRSESESESIMVIPGTPCPDSSSISRTKFLITTCLALGRRIRNGPTAHNHDANRYIPPGAMDIPAAWSQSCLCGRIFSVPQAYTCHKRSCQKTKKRLSGALEKAKEIWQAKKRRKTEEITFSPVAERTSDQSMDTAQSHGPEAAVHPEVRVAFDSEAPS